MPPVKSSKKVAPRLVRQNVRFYEPAEFNLIRQAAKLDGRSLNSYMVRALIAAARTTLAQQSNL